MQFQFWAVLFSTTSFQLKCKHSLIHILIRIFYFSVADNITLTTDETKKVESVVDSILDTASTPVGQSAVLSQGKPIP